MQNLGIAQSRHEEELPVPTSRAPFVSIVMPALNEERYIADAIASLLPRSEALDYELLVLDGGSRDRTREIVKALAEQHTQIRLLHNDRRIQSAALNIASEVCDPRAEILVRADCHAQYPANFAARCADTLIRTASASVVVPMRAVGRQPLQRAIAAAQNSRLGNGGSQHRIAGLSGYVEHGHHAAFDRAVFRALGGYDETAPYNEDAEFDTRLIASGKRIYLDGALTIDYFPRSSLRALARQYFRHGWGRANTLLKHAKLPKLRQLLPVLTLMLAVAGLALWPFAGLAALVPTLGYAAACLLWGAVLAGQSRDLAVLLAGPAAITMHMSWACGFLVRVAEERLPGLVRRVRSLSARLHGTRGAPKRDAGHKA
ncbi:MAG: glycosyltransferase family 2 protein [Hyphomicrobiaceae bacterium]